MGQKLQHFKEENTPTPPPGGQKLLINNTGVGITVLFYIASGSDMSISSTAYSTSFNVDAGQQQWVTWNTANPTLEGIAFAKGGQGTIPTQGVITMRGSQYNTDLNANNTFTFTSFSTSGVAFSNTTP